MADQSITPLPNSGYTASRSGSEFWADIQATVDAEIRNLSSQIYTKAGVDELLGFGVGVGSISGAEVFDAQGRRFAQWQGDATDDVVLTLTGVPTPFIGLLHFTQDATGGHTFQINWEGQGPISVWVDPDPGEHTTIIISHPDETQLFVTGPGPVSGGATDIEVVRDTIAAALIAGPGVLITPNDASDIITVGANRAYGESLAVTTTTSATPSSAGCPNVTVTAENNALVYLYAEAEGLIAATASSQNGHLRLQNATLDARQTAAGQTSPAQVLAFTTTGYVRKGFQPTVQNGSGVFTNNTPLVVPVAAGTHTFQLQKVSSDGVTQASFRNMRLWAEVR